MASSENKKAINKLSERIIKVESGIKSKKGITKLRVRAKAEEEVVAKVRALDNNMDSIDNYTLLCKVPT